MSWKSGMEIRVQRGKNKEFLTKIELSCIFTWVMAGIKMDIFQRLTKFLYQCQFSVNYIFYNYLRL